jgi:hypothetical protein
LLPIRVTVTLVPRTPLFGLIEVSVGAPAVVPVPWYSTAPISNAFGLAGSGRGLPKKSVIGIEADVTPLAPIISTQGLVEAQVS